MWYVTAKFLLEVYVGPWVVLSISKQGHTVFALKFPAQASAVVASCWCLISPLANYGLHLALAS